MNTTLKLISYGHHLISGHYQIHSSFNNVLNFYRNDHLVTLTSKPWMITPVSIVIKGMNFNTIQSLQIHDKSIKINKQEIILDPVKRYHSQLSIDTKKYDQVQKNLNNIMDYFISMAPDMSLAFIFDPKRELNFHGAFELAYVKKVQEGIRLIQNGNLLEGSDKIKGLGYGLTPGGDDFIAGVLFGLFILQILYHKELSTLRQDITRMAMGTNLISKSYIYLAGKGWFFLSFKLFVEALFTATALECIKKMKDLLSWGSTSGADLLSGFFFVLMERNNLRLWSKS